MFNTAPRNLLTLYNKQQNVVNYEVIWAFVLQYIISINQSKFVYGSVYHINSCLLLIILNP